MLAMCFSTAPTLSTRDEAIAAFDPRRTASTKSETCRGAGPTHVARRRTSQTVAAMRTRESASSQPPSIHWNCQNRLAGW
jgi:hypothetical protein